MKETLKLLLRGFKSSPRITPEFLKFVRTFRNEFTKELQSIGATNIQIEKGHFYVSGFFTVDLQIYYFSLPDVRGMEYGMRNNPDSSMNKLMYRTAKDYTDYTGGQNRFAKIEPGMAENMCWSFKVIE